MLDTTKLLAVGLVVLLSMGGAVAAGAGGLGASAMTNTTADSGAGPANIDAAVTFDNGTATFVAMANGTGVENLTVYANGENVGTTGENGTVTFIVSNVTSEDEQELEVEFGGDHVAGELAYERHDGSLLLVEEEVEYERPDDDEHEDETEDAESDAAADAEDEEIEREDDENEDDDAENGDDAESDDDGDGVDDEQDAETEEGDGDEQDDEERDGDEQDDETEDEQSEN